MALTAHVSQNAIVYEPAQSKESRTANEEDTMRINCVEWTRPHGPMREHRLPL